MEVAVFAAAESLGDFLSERIERRAVAHIAVYRRRIARQYNVSRTRGTLQSAVKAWAIVSIGFASWFFCWLVCEIACRRDNHLEGDLLLPRGVNKAGKRVQSLRSLVNKGFAASNMQFSLRFL